ncbi:MAG: tRNA lysidine(34) synthetase TilS [Brevinematales bacterium]|nr:tRNA lysidine(34) synthetase TilS [Brevinematales bacterium]
MDHWRELVGNEVSCVIGFSGGADSTSLLSLLVSLRSFFASFSVVAYHLNHGLRDTAAHDEAFCRSFCDRLGVPLVVDHEDVKLLARQQGWSLEEAGRERRRQGYERVLKEYGLRWVCLAHHRDDQVESFFLRMFRGGGIASLAGMKPKEGVYLRPLLGFSHEELVHYLQRKGVLWCEDESNEERAFDRNWIRHELVPLVEGRFPAFREKVVNFMHFLAEVTEGMEVTLYSLRERVEYFHGGWRLPRKLLRQEKIFWVRELVRTLWREEGIWFVRGRWLEAIREYGDSGLKRIVEMKEGGLFLDRDWLTWVRWKEFETPQTREFRRGDEGSVGPWNIQWEEGDGVPPGFPKASQERCFLPWKIEKLVIRPVRKGDRISLGRGHKKVQDIWVDAHVPWLERRWSFVMESEGRIVAVYIPGYGFRVSREFYIEEGSGVRWQALTLRKKVKI